LEQILIVDQSQTWRCFQSFLMWVTAPNISQQAMWSKSCSCCWTLNRKAEQNVNIFYTNNCRRKENKDDACVVLTFVSENNKSLQKGSASAKPFDIHQQIKNEKMSVFLQTCVCFHPVNICQNGEIGVRFCLVSKHFGHLQQHFNLNLGR